MRYVALPKPPRAWGNDSYFDAPLPTGTVHEQDKAPAATGLLNADGTPLYRVADTVPMGFYRETKA